GCEAVVKSGGAVFASDRGAGLATAAQSDAASQARQLLQVSDRLGERGEAESLGVGLCLSGQF
ncbi:hypothetical protein, partial [Pseudomonas prosekii]|uniref:hypothetical protein n=1 Tax=Pseudomonas prosekii TaxID=1148509 RepID=UPI001C634B45